MALQLKNTKGLNVDSIKFLVYGKSGIGKTSLLKTIPSEDCVIISAENGLLCLKDYSIDSYTVNTWGEVKEALKLAVKSDKKMIALDSLTEISTMLVSFLKSKAEYQNPKNALKLWGEYDEKLTALIKYTRGLSKGVMFTALPQDIQDGGYLVKKPLIKGSATQSMLCSYFDQVFFMTNNEEGERVLRTQPTDEYEAKDRSGSLKEEEPANLQTIINKIKGVTNE